MTAILYHPCPSLPTHFSQEALELVEKCLRKDASRRPTILELLQEPILARRARKLLTPEQFQREFPDGLDEMEPVRMQT